MLSKTVLFVSTLPLFAAPCVANTFYVAGNGSGSACTAAAPCNSLPQAYGLVAPGDAIVCMTTPIISPLAITKSVTIDCASARAPVRDSAFTGPLAIGITINIPVSSSDPLRTVRLRGLSIDGASSNTGSYPSGRIYDRGIDIAAAAAVYIEDCVIANVNQQGIYDHRTGSGNKLFINDTTVSGAVGPGIALGGGAVTAVTLDNASSLNNGYGVAAATGNVVTINRSVFNNNATAGVEGDAGAQIIVDNSKINGNSIGVQSSGSVRVSNSDIAFNSTAISGSTGSFGNNRFSGNSAMGSGLTALGPNSSDQGQQ